MALKAPYLLDFRHKKRRPWTSLDVVMVEPGGFESKDTNAQLKSVFRALGPKKLICRISLSRSAV
jgi:hypothetical protein